MSDNQVEAAEAPQASAPATEKTPTQASGESSLPEGGDAATSSKSETAVENGSKSSDQKSSEAGGKYDNKDRKDNRREFRKYNKNNSKFDPTTMPETDDGRSIRSQVSSP